MLEIKEATRWITEARDRQLTAVSRQMLESAKAAIAEKNGSTAVDLLAYLSALCNLTTNHLELAEIYFELALITYHAGYPSQSIEFIDKSLKYFGPNWAKFATVKWVKGCILWETGQHPAEALQCWKFSINKFKMLSERRAYFQTQRAHFAEQYRRMELHLLKAVGSPQTAHSINSQPIYSTTRGGFVEDIVHEHVRLTPGSQDSEFPAANFNTNLTPA